MLYYIIGVNVVDVMYILYYLCVVCVFELTHIL